MARGFAKTDFDVFTINGLEGRMKGIQERIQPKLDGLGKYIVPFLNTTYSDDFFYHVAKHARRTVHPPDSTWVAWATSKRGYKALPHFQVGLWQSHLFIWFALIYECENKATFANNLKEQLDEVWPNLPKDYLFSHDHTVPDVTALKDLSRAEIIHMLDRLGKVKKAEFLCGITVSKDDARLRNGDKLTTLVEETFTTLKPLYHLAF